MFVECKHVVFCWHRKTKIVNYCEAKDFDDDGEYFLKLYIVI